MWGKSGSDLADDKKHEALIASGNFRDNQKALLKIKQALFAYQYHGIPQLASILTTQTDRVGRKLEEVESALAQASQGIGAYQPMDLRRRWTNFMRTRKAHVYGKATTFITSKLQVMRTRYEGIPQRNAEQTRLLADIRRMEARFYDIYNGNERPR